MKNTRMFLLTPLMAGKLKDVVMPELIQMLAFGGHTVRIDVTAPDERRGVLKIEGGRVSHCELGELVGEEAFHALCAAGGVFEVYRTTAGGEQTISRSWQELLLDAARIEDEASREAELPSVPAALSPEDLIARLSEHPRTRTASIFAELLLESGAPSSGAPARQGEPALVIPPPPAVPPDSAWVEEGEFEVLFGEAIYAYLCRRLDESEELFRRCALLRPNDKRVKTNLQRLAERRGRAT